MALVTDFTPYGASIKIRFGAWISHKIETAQRRKLYRVTMRELQGLSDRDLADLGIGRGEIRSIAKEAAQAV